MAVQQSLVLDCPPQPGELHLILRSLHRVLLSLVEEHPAHVDPAAVPVRRSFAVTARAGRPSKCLRRSHPSPRYSNTTTIFPWSPHTRFDEDPTYLDLVILGSKCSLISSTINLLSFFFRQILFRLFPSLRVHVGVGTSNLVVWSSGGSQSGRRLQEQSF